MKILHDLIENELLEITIINEDGDKIGHCNVVIESNYIWVSSVLVYEGYRRKGYATEMYRYAQNLINKPFKKSDEQTKDAKSLWDSLEMILEKY